MGGKRPYDEVDGESSGRPTKANNDSSKRRKPNANGKGKGKAKEGSNVWAKKRIRAIERLLQRDQGMPQDARNGLERELNGLKSNVSEAAFQKSRSAMISKYHMVRFFERKKAMRLAKQLRRKIEKSEDEEEKKQLEKDLHTAEVDEAYAQYFPLAETYISIYPNAKAQEADDSEDGKAAIAQAALRSERPPMWTVVEQAKSEGPRALLRLRERRPEPGSSNAAPRKAPTAPVKKKDAKEQTGLDAFKSRPQASTATAAVPTTKANGQPLNRRERRKLMHKGLPVVQQSDDEDDDEGGFLEL
ncbi:rRNA-processing protein efg1 domain-containing protein [Sarocladium implicatum]|nr:rRNA-processing protein efg1 domain-containing protein [Sarocladium implicatum]